MAVTAGNYTVGSGGDYSNWAAAIADTDGLTGNLTFTQISDVTDNTAFTINIALNGYTLKLTSNKRHYGNFSGGWKTTLSMNRTSNYCIGITSTSKSAGAKIIIDGLNFDYTGTITNYAGTINLLSNTTAITHIISNSLFSSAGLNIQHIRTGAAKSVLNAHNVVAANSRHGIILVTVHTSTLIENCTFYGMQSAEEGKSSGIANYANAYVTIRNIAAFGNSRDFTYSSSYTSGMGNALNYKCASSDGSGSEAGLINLTTADQFQSLDIADGDLFLKLKSTSVLINGGVVPSLDGNTEGIRGTPRPHDTDKYSIGADEFLVNDICYSCDIRQKLVYNPAVRRYLF